jgi:hypothetical protein
MKKIICLTFVLSLFILSCSSNESNDNSNSGVVLLRKLISSNSQGTVTTNLNYNGNKIVNATSSNGTENIYTYTGDLITKTETYNNNVLFRSVLYSYNSQNELISGVELNHNTNVGTKTILTYNSNGTITYNMYDGDLISQTLLWGTYTATLNNGEITTFKDESSNTTDTYTYDLKNNYKKNILGYEKISIAVGSGVSYNIDGVFQNLIQQQRLTQTGSQYTQKTGQHTYNAENRPVTSIIKEYTSSGAIYSTSNISYFYE